MSIISINPASGDPIAEYPVMSAAETSAIVDAVHAAWLGWRTLSFTERAVVLKRAAKLLRARQHDLARLMAIEMGKPLPQGAAEAEKCAWACDFYAKQASIQLADEFVATEATHSLVAFEPLGVVLAVMPWNFPFWQVFRFAAPALMAGNAAVLKQSIIPGPPPVMTARFCFASRAPRFTASLYQGSEAGSRADPKMVTAVPAAESVSKESTNSAMIRKMRQGSSRIKPLGAVFIARSLPCHRVLTRHQRVRPLR